MSWETVLGWVAPLLLVFLLFYLPGIMRRAEQNRARRELFARFQRKRRSRVITIVHRQQPSLFGLGDYNFLDFDDAETILGIIARTKADKPIDIILHTPGGYAVAALQIARAFKAHRGRKTVFVPHMAMSGGTLIALAADEIVMGEHAMLGPIDPQIGGVPAASLARVVVEKGAKNVRDDILIYADVAEKALVQMKKAACELMEDPLSHEGSCSIAEELASGRYTHDYPIMAGEARALGLNVSTDLPVEAREIVESFPRATTDDSVQWARIKGFFGKRSGLPKLEVKDAIVLSRKD